MTDVESKRTPSVSATGENQPDSESVATHATTTTALSSTTEELFRIWKSNCLAITSRDVTEMVATKIQKKVSALQAEALNFFATLVAGTSLQVGTMVLTTRASHTDSLALLIQTLEPCFVESATLVSRWAALSCLVGSIQACRTAHMPLPLMNLLRAFLLPHVGPMALATADTLDVTNTNVNSNMETDINAMERIRDTALSGLVALLLCRTVTESATSDSTKAPEAWLLLCLTMAQSGVQQRCAQAEHDNYYYSRSSTTAAGLSLLPRLTRTQCFDVVQAAVQAVAESIGHEYQPSPAVLMEAAAFGKFAASLLHGESDPRCLLQLLTLLDSLQQSFSFLGSHFPTSEVFDAVAPYYPIQFNPPPHDTHGITRSSLRHAVLEILSCSSYDAGRHYDDNMVTLSLGLLLENLVPPPEDGPLTYSEQLEALDDIRSFLLRVATTDQAANCDKLDEGEMKKISDALQSIHESSCLAVAKGDTTLAKEVAEFCRTVVAQVAVHVETSSPTLWRVFVGDPVRLLSMRQDGSPSGRVATAYLACLAASGGTQTVRTSLQAGLSQLYSRLETNDHNTTSSSLYGIGAFFSSCRVAMERAAQNGISLHPHPLQPYTKQAVDLINAVLESTDTSDAVALHAAAVRALESVILAAPMSLFADDRVDCIVVMIRTISLPLLAVADNDSDESIDEVLSASSVTIGTLLGKALDSSVAKSNDEVSVTSTSADPDRLTAFLLQDFFPALLASVKIRSRTSLPSRHDNKSLALATAFSYRAAAQIVQSLAETLHTALLGSNYANATFIAETLSFLFGLKDGFAVKAYQEMSPSSVTAFAIMKSIVHAAPCADDGIESDFGISNLQLPQSNEDRQKTTETLEKAYAIIRLLRRGYECGIPYDHFLALAVYANRLLPPLNDADAVQLSVALPFLSAAMECTDMGNVSNGEEKTICDEVRGMAKDLGEFALATEYFSPARSHAARCLHEIIAILTPRNVQVCPARELMTNVLSRLKESIDNVQQEDQKEGWQRAASLCADCVNMMATLGSAAARRGGSSSKTSDSIIQFLVDLACLQKATLQVAGEQHELGDVQLESLAQYEQDEPAKLSIRAASAFGSILSGSRNSLWQQRLTHISFHRIMGYVNDVSGAGNSSSQSLGLLSALCHAICASNLSNLPPATLAASAEFLTCSLSPSRLCAAKQVDTTLPQLVLAALLKLMSASPASFPNVYPLVTGSLHAFASAADLDQRSEVACKVLALQTIAGVTQLHSSPELLKSIKPAVVSLLGGATNHPSGLLRIAAGEVRNAWYFVE